MDLYAVQVVQVRCDHPKTKNQRKKQTKNRDHKQTQKEQKPHQKTKQEEPHYRSGQDSSMRIPAAYVLTIKPCMYRNNTEDRDITTARCSGRVQKTHSTLRKPGVPPARIPEITTRRPQGTTGTTIPRWLSYAT